ncbi:MAG: hypothetical protein AAGG68_07690 [Bacteroidota bacterium]
MKRINSIKSYIFLLFGLFSPSFMLAQADTIKIGMFVNDLFDLNLSDRSFNADFWLWFNYQDSTLHPMENIELPNAKSYDADLAFMEEKEGILWATKKIQAAFKKDWNITNFPFDIQMLEIKVEESDKDISDLVYLADLENTKYYENISVSNWDIIDFGIKTAAVQYPTTYGDPTLSGSSTYARATVFFKLKRKSLGLFFTLFTGVYVAFFISVLVFFIDPIYVDPRFGLSVGGLFAAVGNKYIVDSILPQSTAFTLADKIHVMTYFFLLVCIIISVISLRIWKNGNEQKSKRLDRISFYAVTSLFVLLNLIFILQVSP